MHPPDIAHPFVSDFPDGVIDPCSLICLSCHDGSNAVETGINATEEGGSGKHSHPLGIDYSIALSRNTGLHPEATIPPEILFPEGKVGCESCHNLYSAVPYFLVISNFNSALCLGCHAK
jgi:predicted CXXCH cytochrome family protein